MWVLLSKRLNILLHVVYWLATWQHRSCRASRDH